LDILVNIDVPDLARGVDFYTAALGLTLRRHLGPTIAELAGGPVPIFLLEKAEGSTATPDSGTKRTFTRHWTPVHLDVVVTDIDAGVAAAVAAGATVERPPAEADWGKLALMADPFGNGFCLVEFLNRGYDEIASA
jgi:predicted enzyme related to lactoylglutathione lyase